MTNFLQVRPRGGVPQGLQLKRNLMARRHMRVVAAIENQGFALSSRAGFERVCF
jgi:hypothetical protein